MPRDSRELLFGDDWESDHIIYSLYADVLAGHIGPEALGDILARIDVDPHLIAQAQGLIAGVDAADVVEKIYINVERRTPPTSFHSFGPRLVPTFNYFQTAACVFEGGYLNLAAVAQVAEQLIKGSGYTPSRLANSLDDIVRRGHLQPPSAVAVREYLRARGLLPQRAREGHRLPLWRRVSSWFTSKPAPARAPTETINYQTLVAEWRAAR